MQPFILTESKEITVESASRRSRGFLIHVAAFNKMFGHLKVLGLDLLGPRVFEEARQSLWRLNDIILNFRVELALMTFWLVNRPVKITYKSILFGTRI